MKKFLPILNWLPTYSKAQLKGDIPAGLTVGILLIPQGMAYAMIAGLPPEFGLYAALVPQIIYAILGTSRQLSVGPVAMDSLLVASGLGALKFSGIDDYISAAIFLALLMGGIQLLLGLFRGGFLVNFLSKPVISGFTSAAALIIGLSQLKHLLGVDIERSSRFHEILQNVWPKIPLLNTYSVLIGLAGIAVIMLFKKWRKSFPASLVVVVGSILLMYFSGLHSEGVQIVGEIPKGLPEVHLPSVSYDQILDLLPIAVALSLVAFMEAISIGKSIEHQHEDYQINPNQELRALGLANIIGSIFSAYPTTGGFSRSAVNNQAGAKTGMASIFAAIVIALTLLFLTPLFYYLPKPILASVIMVAVFGLIDIKYPLQLLAKRKDEFLLLALTFLVTLFVGIIAGIIVGILFSLLLLVYRTAKPHVAELARIKGTEYFKNVDRFSEDVEVRNDILIIRFDSQLYFGNTEFFKSILAEKVTAKGDALKAVILNAESMNYIDSTGAIVLINVIKELKRKDIQFYISGAIGPTRDIIYKSEIIKTLGEDYLFVKTHEAVRFIDTGEKDVEMQGRVARQNKPEK
ncbi:MAG: sulfate permease [Crocinitomicaceae bacterium]